MRNNKNKNKMKNQSLDLYTDLYIALLNSKRTKVPNCPDYLKHVNELRVKYEMFIMSALSHKASKEEIEKVTNHIKTPLTMEQMINKFIK